MRKFWQKQNVRYMYTCTCSSIFHFSAFKSEINAFVLVFSFHCWEKGGILRRKRGKFLINHITES